MPTRLSRTKSATRTAPAITIGEYARRTFWLVTASAACDSRRRRSIGRRSAVAVAAAVAAASNMERALIGSTVSKSVLAQAFRHARAEAEFPASRLRGQIGRNSYRWYRGFNVLQTRRDSPPIPLRPSPSARNAERFFREEILRGLAPRRDLPARSRSRPPSRPRYLEQTAHRCGNRKFPGCRRHWRRPSECPPRPPRSRHRASNPRGTEQPAAYPWRSRIAP